MKKVRNAFLLTLFLIPATILAKNEKIEARVEFTFSCGKTGRVCGHTTEQLVDRILMLEDQQCPQQ